MKNFLSCLSLFFIIGLLTSCKTDVKETASSILEKEPEQIRMRLSLEPDKMNPMLAKSKTALQLSNLIFQPMLDMDPQTLQFAPVLGTSLPVETEITDGEYEGGKRFDFTIREDAVWSDGKAITAEDYYFTVKTVNCPAVEANTWNSFLAKISDITIDETNPKKFSVIIGESYMLAVEVAGTFSIFPKHIYDATSALDKYSLSDLRDENKKSEIEADPKVIAFAEDFRSAKFNRETIEGSGPYQIESWEANQGIVLKKKENWWGDKYREENLFKAYPKKIVYSIIADEATALTALKEGEIDLMAEIKPANFVDLKKNTSYNDQLNFYSPSLPSYIFLCINNKGKFTNTKEIRRALAHLVDVDLLIETLMLGTAQRTVGPVHPNSENYNSSLQPIAFDPAKSKQIFSEQGWTDSDGDGFLDKVIDGVKTNFEITLQTSTSQLSKDLSIVLTESFNKAGVDLKIDAKQFNLVIQDLLKRNYDMAGINGSSFSGLWDPYQSWHSNSDSPTGSNIGSFQNAEADAVIESIRSTTDPNERKQLYKDLQKIIYDEQVHIFLFAPSERIIANSKFDLIPSNKRPGFFEHQVLLK